MNNKFLIGARMAGVTLALVLLGVGSVLAAGDVVVNLSDIKVVNGTLQQIARPSTAAPGATPPTGQSWLGADVFGKWGGTGASAGDTVRAKFVWGGVTANRYDSALTFDVSGTGTVNVYIQGTLANVKVQQITFSGLANSVVYWDGGTVTGEAAGTSKDKATFFVQGTAAHINILRGTITSNAQTIIDNVGAAGSSVDKNTIGAPSLTNAGGNVINLTSKGSKAAIKGSAVVIYPPNTGTYSITSDNIAIEGVNTVKIGDNDLDNSAGAVNIKAWQTAVAATITDAAILTGANANSNITIYGRSGRVSVSTKGVTVLKAPNTSTDSVEAVYVKGAKLDHAAPTGLAGAIVVTAGKGETSQANIRLEGVEVSNGTTATNPVAGQIAVATGYIRIKGGSFAPASGSTGNAVQADSLVVVEAAKITAGGTSVATPDYVVKSNKAVVLKAGGSDKDSAVVAWTGSANVGGIKAPYVRVEANGARKAEVRVGGGSGSAIYVTTRLTTDLQTARGADPLTTLGGTTGYPVNSLVNIKGGPDGSAFIKASTGKAVEVDNISGGIAGFVTFFDAIVARTGAPADGKTNLVDVSGADVTVDGTKLTTAAINVAALAGISPTSTAAGRGIFVKSNSETADLGGTIKVHGGQVHGGTAAIEAISVFIEGLAGTGTARATTPTSIQSTSGVTVKSRDAVTINNPNAKIVNVSGGLSAANATSAVVYSAKGGITVYNVDSVKASSQATALLTTEKGSGVTVYGGVIKSVAGPAIVSSGSVLVDKDDDDAVISIIGTDKNGNLNARGNVVVSSGSTNAAAAYNSAITVEGGYDVDVGVAKVEATGVTGFASAIKNTDGDVYVWGTTDRGQTMVVSASGSAIVVSKGLVKVTGGEVRSDGRTSPAANAFVAAIHVTDGKVQVGQGDVGEDVRESVLTSDGSALAVYSTGAAGTDVILGDEAVLNVKGINQSYGGVKVTHTINVNYSGGLTVSTSASKAFSIDAASGVVTINGGFIYSKEGNAVTTAGGNIVVNDGDITGDKGILLYAKKNATTGKAGDIVVNGTTDTVGIYNKNGTAVRGDDTVYVNGGWIHTDTDTAVAAGTATAAGLVRITGGKVQASGQHGKSNPVAVSSKKVRLLEDGVVLANEPRSSTDNNERYVDAKATGILIRTGGGKGELIISTNSENRDARVEAYGADTAIVNRDTAVTVIIAEHGKIIAGNNGTAIKSQGPIKISREDSAAPSEDQRDDTTYAIWIKAGNGPNARGILMPIKNGVKKKDLFLGSAFVEAGSDGAYAVDCDTNTTVEVYHSVVLVRHGSTGIRAQGGVRVRGGYVEVLATNDNRTGTAITGREIRIDGLDEDVDEDLKSEVHSKDVAVYDGKEGAVVEVTGVIHMSGEVRSHLNVGSSVLGKSATLSMGSENSRDLWRLNTYSDVTEELERGKTLYVPAGVRVSVADNGSRLETELSDTVKIEGTVTTVGQQAAAEFVNNGKIIVKEGGNVKFNAANAGSLKNNSEGKVVLSIGAKLNDSLLVHDTGAFMARKYTFLKWADSLSGDNRGPGQVIIPPLYATLYGNQSVFIDEEDLEPVAGSQTRDYWSADAKRTDSVYTAKLVKYPVDKRYKKYLGEDEEDLPKGDFSVTGLDAIRVDTGDGLATVLFTEAGTFKRVATLENEAGVGTKEYTHVVSRVTLKQIKEWQTEGSAQNFFDGYLNNIDERVIDRTDSVVIVWDDIVDVKYTGSTAKLLDGIKGARFAVPLYDDVDNPGKPIYFKGLGVHQFWYKGVDGTSYPLTSTVPVKVGVYEIWASFAQGMNFEAVPTDASSLVYIGKINVVEGDLTSVFGVKDNEYIINVRLEGRKAYTNVTVALPGLLRYGAKYDIENLEPTGSSTGTAGLGGNPARIVSDSVLTFNIVKNSADSADYNQYIEFDLGIINTADPANLEEGLSVVVRVDFVTPDELKKAKPVYLTVDYVNEKLTGLLANTNYTINGDAVKAGVTETGISADWIGDTIKVVALPGVGSYEYPSDTAKIAIGIRPAVAAALTAVKGDSASNVTAADGRLNGTTTAMEYKHADSAQWKPAGSVVTTGLVAGTYNVRLAATKTAFASAEVDVVVYAKKGDAVLEADREIPVSVVTEVATIKPVAKVTASFTAGPSPVSRNAGKVAFFSAKAVKAGSLYVFDLTGNAVAKVKAKAGTGEIASWNLKDRGGKSVAEGSYVVKGTLTGKDGKKDKVSFVFSVVK